MEKSARNASNLTEKAAMPAQPGDEERVLATLEALMQMYETQVFSDFDRRTASEAAMRDFRHLLRKRLLEDKPPPTIDEVDGLKILALDYLHYHPDRPPQPYGMGQF